MFEAAGQAGSDALLNTVIMGSVNVASTIVAIVLVDRFGRRFLFLQGVPRWPSAWLLSAAS
jgi:hypothetical protein